MKLLKLEGYNLETDSMNDGSNIHDAPLRISLGTMSNYEDISSAENWDKYGMEFTDYLFSRDEINKLLFPKCNPNYPTIDFSGWFTNLTNSERELMSRYILAPYQLRRMVFSEETDRNNWFYLLAISQGTGSNNYTGRALIIEKMRRYIADLVRVETLTMAQTQEFFRDVDAKINWYVNSADPSFKFWLNNEYDYVNSGFAQKSYFTQDILDGLMHIYNGYDYLDN